MKTNLLRKARLPFGLFGVWTDYVALLLLVSGVVCYYLNQPKPPAGSTVSILRVVDSATVSPTASAQQRMTVINVLEGRLANSATLKASRDDQRMQARVFYAAIFAGFAALLFGSRFNAKVQAGLFLLAFISVMYLLDVHMEDMDNRYATADATLVHAADSLVNCPVNDSLWFVCDFDLLAKQLNDAHTTRFWRKAYLACRPSLEQLAFYFLPWILIYFQARSSVMQRKHHL
jgi:hypothetical protein